MEFIVLTATRLSEATKATWQEFELDKGIWSIPAERIKAPYRDEEGHPLPHRIPLSKRARAILEEAGKRTGAKPGNLVFQTRKGSAFNAVAAGRLLKAHGYESVTTHGMRTSFRSWAAERTSYPSELCELALGHQIGTDVLRSYMRSDMVERRRALMEEWSAVCASKPAGDVVRLSDRRT